MSKTVYIAQSNYLDVPKVFGNVKALYNFAFNYLNSETQYLDREGKPYPATYSRFNTMLKLNRSINLYGDEHFSQDQCVKIDTATINGD